MRRARALLLMLALSACATSSPASSQWARIEGCWVEGWTDHWPAYIQWRRDPEHPGGYLGDWHREAAQGDEDRVSFTLRPVGDQMHLCDSAPGGAERCMTAVFGRAGWRMDGVAVFDAQDTYQEFGYAGATMPFFSGGRRDCE